MPDIIEATATFKKVITGTATTKKVISAVANFNITPAAFLPSDLDALFQWIDLGSGVTLNGSDVSAITDRSGNGHNIEQTTPADQPLFVASAQNSLPGMEFDGVSEFMNSTEAASVWTLLHSGSDYGIFCVFKTTDANPDTSFNIFSTSSDATTERGIGVIYDDRLASARNDMIRYRIYNGNFGVPLIAAEANDSFPANAYQVMGLEYDDTNTPNGEILLDNVSQATDNKAGSPSANVPAATLQVGRRANGTSFAKITVLEWIICNTVTSAADKTKIQNYFDTKYAI